MKVWIITAVGAALLASAAAEAAEPRLRNDNERINDSIGYQMGGDFKRQGIEISPDLLIRGIQDALAETPPLMTGEEMRTTLVALKKRIVADAKERRLIREEERLEKGRKFLAENATKEGVVTLASGLQYQILRKGSGRKPTMQDVVTVRYRGTRIDGTEFDSSGPNGQQVRFPLSAVIAGWREALPMMREGAKWKLFLPPKLAFGDKGPLEEETIIYDIELIAVHPEQSAPEPSPRPHS